MINIDNIIIVFDLIKDKNETYYKCNIKERLDMEAEHIPVGHNMYVFIHFLLDLFYSNFHSSRV